MSLISTGVTLSAGNGVALGLNAAFRATYDTRLDYWKPRMALIADEVPSTMLLESYYYSQTRPYPRRWARGSSRGTKGFKRVRYGAVNKDWELGIGWHRNDLNDDVTRSLMQDAVEAAQHFATLRPRCFAQVKNGATDADLLDTLPTAPDGASIYSATDGDGADRFGVSGGNVITSSGTANEAMILKDFFAAQTRFQLFLDTEGQPLLDPGMFAAGFVIEHPPQLTEVMARAFKMNVIVSTVTASGALGASASNVAVAGTSNPVLEQREYGVTLLPNPWLTDTTDWFVTMIGAPVKPLAWQDRQAPEEHILSMDNNDRHAVETKEEGIYWDSRGTVVANLPFSTIKVD